MKVTITEPNLDPDSVYPERTVSVENCNAETFDDLVDLFRGAALAIGYAPSTVDSLRTDRDARDEADAAEAHKALNEALIKTPSHPPLPQVKPWKLRGLVNSVLHR